MNRKLCELSDEELTEVVGGCGAGLMDFDTGVYGIIEKPGEAISKKTGRVVVTVFYYKRSIQ